MNEKEAIRILESVNPSKKLIEHSLFIKKISLEFVKKHNIKIDRNLLVAGSILHDIGKVKTPGPEHAYEGAKILRKKGVSENIARLVENHIYLSKEDIERDNLNLPLKDYIPERAEEKIVSFFDKLTRGKKLMSIEEYLKIREKESGKDSEIFKSIKKGILYLEEFINRFK